MKQYGYSAPLRRKLVSLLAKFLSRIFCLSKPSIFTAEVLQASLPYFRAKISHNISIKFLVNHGRLLWRARTLLTEEPLMVDWLKCFPKTAVYCDIGANVGNFVLLAKALYPDMYVYAAELDFNNLYLLYHNLVVNKMQDNVLLLPFALIDKQRLCTINYRDLSQGDALQSVDKLSPFDTQISPLSHNFTHLGLSLDTVFNIFSLKQPTHIKIDVDGNEGLLLSGAKQTLKKASSIYFENSNTSDCHALVEFLIREGFYLDRSETIFSKQDKNKVNCINQILSNVSHHGLCRQYFDSTFL